MHRAFTSLMAIAALLLLTVPATALTFTHTAGDADTFADRDGFDNTSNMDYLVFSSTYVGGSAVLSPPPDSNALVSWTHGYGAPTGITGATLRIYVWDLEGGENAIQDVVISGGGFTQTLGTLPLDDAGDGNGTEPVWTTYIDALPAGPSGAFMGSYGFVDVTITNLDIVSSGAVSVDWNVGGNAPAGAGNFGLAIDYAVLSIDFDGELPEPGAIPEPGSLALLGLGLAGLAVGTRRRRNRI